MIYERVIDENKHIKPVDCLLEPLQMYFLTSVY